MLSAMLMSKVPHGAIGSRRQGLIGARSIVRQVDIGGICYSTFLVVVSPHALRCWSDDPIKVCSVSFEGHFYI